MSTPISVIVYPVRDVAKAKELYARFLGTKPYVDGPYYVGFRVGDQEIGLDPRGHSRGGAGPICYRDVPDIRSELRALIESGATMLQDVTDVAKGLLIALVRDQDQNVIGLRQLPPSTG